MELAGKPMRYTISFAALCVKLCDLCVKERPKNAEVAESYAEGRRENEQ
jgi:hypothetical protein